MSRVLFRSVVPLAMLLWGHLVWAQDPVEKWEFWYSETLGLAFMMPGEPVEEMVEFSGPLGESLEKTIGVGFNVGEAEFSITRLHLKPGQRLTVRELLALRTEVPRRRATDFKVREEKESLDSDYPTASVWIEYTGPDETLVSRRILAVSNEKGLWLVEASGLGQSVAREAANKVFDSLRMDAAGRVRPGAKRQ